MGSIYVCEVPTPQGVKHYVTLLAPEVVRERGLRSEAIVGEFSPPLQAGEAITPERFVTNSHFLKFMHEVIARDAPGLKGCREEAARTENGGLVFIIDCRTKTPEGPVPPQDIIGIFTAEGGRIGSESYKPNPNHAILTAEGFFRLPTGLYECLISELEERMGGAR